MKAIALAALFALLSTPIAASAQQTAPCLPQQHQTAGGPPHFYKHWMKVLSGLGLSSDQQQKIQSPFDSYAQAHPAGSPDDPQAKRELRSQILAVLTPAQQAQFDQQMQAWWQAHQAQIERLKERCGQQPQQPQQPPPPPA